MDHTETVVDVTFKISNGDLTRARASMRDVEIYQRLSDALNAELRAMARASSLLGEVVDNSILFIWRDVAILAGIKYANVEGRSVARVYAPEDPVTARAHYADIVKCLLNRRVRTQQARGVITKLAREVQRLGRDPLEGLDYPSVCELRGLLADEAR